MKLLSNTVTATHDHNCVFLGLDGEAFVELDQHEADCWNTNEDDMKDRVFNMLDRDLKNDGAPFTVINWDAPVIVEAGVPFTVTPRTYEPTPIDVGQERAEFNEPERS